MQIGDGTSMLQFNKQFDTTTEVFASFWVRVPDGTNFPASWHPAQYPGASATNSTLATVDSWSDTAISATVRQGTFSVGEAAYLYVIDKDGNVNAEGYPISFALQSDVTAPVSPSGLSV